MGVAQSQLGRGARVLGPKINEMFSYGVYLTNIFQVDKIKASWPKIDFYDFCLYKDIAKDGVARSCGKATDFRAQIFLGCYFAHGSTLKRSLLIIREKEFFLTTLMCIHMRSQASDWNNCVKRLFVCAQQSTSLIVHIMIRRIPYK